MGVGWQLGIGHSESGAPCTLRGSYRWNDHILFYTAVDNLFNAPPPNLATRGGAARIAGFTTVSAAPTASACGSIIELRSA